jgi:3-oxoacyl-[acyl-carrier-protein] synthase II
VTSRHEPAAVTGLGLVTAAGIGTKASWEGVLSGVSAAATDPVLAGIPVDFSCRVPDFDAAALLGRKAARRLDRFVQLAVVAAREAVADSGLDPHSWDGARVGVVVGCGMGGAATWEEQHRRLVEHGPGKVSPMLIPMLVPNMVAGHLAMEFGATGPNLVTATACASGATAIGVARDLLRSGACDVAVAGGVDEFGDVYLSALAERLLLHPASRGAGYHRRRAGTRGWIITGEGAAMLVLEATASAGSRGA